MIRDILKGGDEVFGDVYMEHGTRGVTALNLATRYLGMGVSEALDELQNRGPSRLTQRGELARRQLTGEVLVIERSIFD
jgi:hypothetical protein